MAKFRVCGPRTVNGAKPGDTFEVDDDTPINLAALLTSRHIELVEPIVGEHGPEVVDVRRTRKPKGGEDK